MRKSPLACLLLAFAAFTGPAFAACPAPTPAQGVPPGVPLPVFPASNWWNLDIRNAPVDPNSANFIQWIGPTRSPHPDFGGTDLDNGAPYIYGIPYAVVDGSQDKLPVTFEVWDESDGVNMQTGEGVPFYPIPIEAIDQAHWIEGGPPGTVDLRGSSDRHLIMVDCTNNDLYELYNVWFDESQSQWRAYSGAFFDMDTNNRRPETWTSADASGMAIFPGLVRYDEAADPNLTDLGHAIRMTTRDTNGYVFPASHDAGNGVGAPPLGTRLRLKALVNGQDPALRTNDPIARRIMRTMQKYGMIVADNGSDMYFTGTYDERWDNGVLNPAFNLLDASDFEVIQLGWNPGPLPTLSIADLSINEGDSNIKNMTFTVTLSQASASPVTFRYSTVSGTAVAGADFVAASNVLVTIPAGLTQRTFSIGIVGETLVEPLETFNVVLSDPTGATINDGSAIGYIINNDGARLLINDPVATEGNAGTKVITFTVTLSQVAPGPVSYTFLTQAGGTATTGVDYVATSQASQVIPQGQLSKTHTVVINGDTAVEDNETILAYVRQPVGASVWDGQGTGYILNDDGPTLSVLDASAVEPNGADVGKMNITVKLSQALAVPVTFRMATAPVTATHNSDYQGISSSLLFEIPAGQTSLVHQTNVYGDNAVEPNETFTVTLSEPTNASLLDRQGIATIVNNDGPTLSVNDAAVTEGNAGQKFITFTVSLSQVATVPVTYHIMTGNLTAIAGEDYVASNLSGETIPAGQLMKTFTVTLNGDTTMEPNETFRVTIVSVSPGATLFKYIGTGTITNDD